MKVVTAQEMARIEQLAYEAGAEELTFMNEAGRGVADCIQRLVADLRLIPKILFLCGSGNNAGDAYVAAHLLSQGGYNVACVALAPYERSSSLCQLQSKHFRHHLGKILYVSSIDEIEFGEATLIVDGILGTGFKKEVEGLYKEVIEAANATKLPILSIDIPSGINGSTGEIGGVAIKAYQTLFLGLPKTGCFVGEAWSHVGKCFVHDFGLSKEFIQQAEANFEWLDLNSIEEFLPPIERCRHKYQAGYVVGLGGSKGMSGAPILSGFTALRSGAGIVRFLHPPEMPTAQVPLELIHQGYQNPTEILMAMERASAVYIGPGMGMSEEAKETLAFVLPKIEKPCVIDADALNLIAKYDLPIPRSSILTPHIGEMLRLLGLDSRPPLHELIELTHAFSRKHDVVINLKGAPTFLFHPDKIPHICTRGDAGMATAGSGDVLTGIMAASLAQLQDPWKAALFGSFIHGYAGEKASKEKTAYCMIASDITNQLPAVFKELSDC